MARSWIVTEAGPTTDVCAGAVPAQIVVVCGIFGNITVSDTGHGGGPAQPVRAQCAGPLDHTAGRLT